MAEFEVLVIGSGLSGIITLKDMLSALVTNKVYKPLRIAVIEQQETLWNGIPFGSNLSVNCLTITSVVEFLTNAADKTEFTTWLTANKERCLSSYLNEGGFTAQEWFKHNRELIDQNQWDPLFIPRYWYRIYITESLNQLIQIATETRAIALTAIKGEAVSVKQINHTYEVAVKAMDSVHVVNTEKLILAIGSPPVKPLKLNLPEQGITYTNDLYCRPLSASVQEISAAMQAVTAEGKRNLLIAGSNASCTELLYLLGHDEHLQQYINKIVVVSSSGALPQTIDTGATPCPAFENIEALKKQPCFTGKELISATMADIALVNGNGVNTKNVEKLVTQAMELKHQLNADERAYFETHFGTAVTASIRRMGNDYHRGISHLRNAGKLTVLKGKFRSLENVENDARVLYEAEDGRLAVYDLPFAALINCTGFELLDECSSKLINSLVQEGICTVNSTQKGFEVNECFEANANVYVMGPLLAGNNNKNIHYWHVENVARILQLSAIFIPQFLKTCKVNNLGEQYVAGQIEELKRV